MSEKNLDNDEDIDSNVESSKNHDFNLFMLSIFISKISESRLGLKFNDFKEINESLKLVGLKIKNIDELIQTYVRFSNELMEIDCITIKGHQMMMRNLLSALMIPEEKYLSALAEKGLGEDAEGLRLKIIESNVMLKTILVYSGYYDD